MSMSDPIADMFTRLRNAQTAGHKDVSMPASKMKLAIAKVLKSEGFINGYREEAVEKYEYKKVLIVDLKYFNNKPVIEWIKRVSRPGLRQFTAATEMPEVMDKLGIAIISTSKGIMSGRDAAAIGQGGEVLGYVA